LPDWSSVIVAGVVGPIAVPVIVLAIATRLASGRPGLATDWEVVVRMMEFQESRLFSMHGLANDRLKFEITLNTLIGRAQVRPVVRNVESSWRVEFVGGHRICCALYGALICQLMLAATRTEGAVICASCGIGFTPKRRPNQARRAYCRLCREKKVPERDAARDYRARIKSSSHTSLGG